MSRLQTYLSWIILVSGLLAGCQGQIAVRDYETPKEEGPRDNLPTDFEGQPEEDGPSPDEPIEDEETPQPDDEELPGDEDEDNPVIPDDEDDEDPDDPVDNDPDSPEPGQYCNEWQDCGPHYGDQNSGFDCIENTCECDATGQWSSICTQQGGYFIYEECICVFSGEPPPSSHTDGCYWSWYQGPCDADRWVDTSHYEDVCGYNANDQWECNSVWVESGYWEAGDCPAGYWQELC